MEYICFNSEETFSTLNGCPLRWVDKVTYFCSSVSSIESGVSMCLAKAWTAINRLIIIWKSDLSNKIKRDFFQAAVVSILLYGCTTWTLTKCIEIKLDGNYTRMLQAILNKSWKQHPIKQQLYGYLVPISKNIQVRWRREEHCWRSKGELISDVLLWNSSHGHASFGWPAKTCLQQLCTDSGCSLEDLLGAIDDRNRWSKRVRDICARSATWWW